MSRPVDVRIHGHLDPVDYESFIAKIAELVGQWDSELEMEENFYER